MIQTINIRNYPVFPKNTFRDHPDLFDRFNQNHADHLQDKYDRLWKSMPRYEEGITWPLVTGPGFWGATHPGADTVFVDIMVGINSYVYNSDCLYVNPKARVYAISDPPGITTGSRILFERLDRALKTSQDGLAAIVNRLSKQTEHERGATLSLVRLPREKPGIAELIIAGDTFMFHGNLKTGALRLLTGTHEFIGTPYASFDVQSLPVKSGDFFLIASDGILSLTANDPERRLERALRMQMDGNLDDMVHRTMVAANEHYREHIYDRSFSRFGGNDNISVLLVYPEQIIESDHEESIMLGGYIEERE